MAPFHDGEMSERLKEPVLKTGDAQASVGSNPTLSATSLISEYRICRSTQEAEGTPLERVQVVNSGARVQIPPSPFAAIR